MKRLSERDKAISAGELRYFTGRPCKRGHISERLVSNHACIECSSVMNKKNRKKYYKMNPEKYRQISKKNRENFTEDQRVKSNLSKYRYKKNNKARYAQYESIRRAKQLSAIPTWYDVSECEKIYKMRDEITQKTGVPHDVDHIYPLNSDWVCGLHVLENLRIIPSKDNQIKGNRRCQH